MHGSGDIHLAQEMVRGELSRPNSDSECDAIHILLVVVSSRTCQSSLARDLLRALSHLQLFKWLPHKKRSTSARIDPRPLPDQPTTSTMVVSSMHSRVQWSKTATCTVVLAPRAPTSSVSVPMILQESRSGWPGVDCPASDAASSTARPSCLRQHEVIIVPTWFLPITQAWFLDEMDAQCDTD